jgi:hypothetical protein
MSLACLLFLCLPAAFGQTAGESPKEYSFTVSGSKAWTDAGLDLAAGDKLAVAAENANGAGKTCSPEGMGSAAKDSPLPSAPAGALVAKVSEQGRTMLIGGGREITAESPGGLWMRLNFEGSSDCAVLVKVKVVRATNGSNAAERRDVKQQLSSAAKVWLQGQFGASSSAEGQSSTAAHAKSAAQAIPASAQGRSRPSLVLDADLRKHLDELPRRVHDHAGNLGDMVNLVIIGSQERLKTALEAANWHLADVDSKEAGLKAILDAYERKEYLEMPMSHLYLFDRTQDFGYEQAQPYAVVASRHHFRLWKAPFTSSGEILWVGAATHDIGFEKDVRTGHLTHKIDPDVDRERENLAASLNQSGRVKDMDYYLPPNPVLEAKNASGGGYHSDGRMLVVILK